MNYDEAIDFLLREGAKILHPRCVVLAKKNHLPLHVVSFQSALSGRENVFQRAFGTRIEDLVSIREEHELLYEDDQADVHKECKVVS